MSPSHCRCGQPHERGLFCSPISVPGAQEAPSAPDMKAGPRGAETRWHPGPVEPPWLPGAPPCRLPQQQGSSPSALLTPSSRKSARWEGRARMVGACARGAEYRILSQTTP